MKEVITSFGPNKQIQLYKTNKKNGLQEDCNVSGGCILKHTTNTQFMNSVGFTFFPEVTVS